MEDKTTIKKLFHEEGIQFVIPAYQRAYSWEYDKDRKQIEQFITDIKEQNPLKKYFLGHFLFETDKINENKYWVIDGQQRLTTIVIFFACLIRELEKRKLDLERKRSELPFEEKIKYTTNGYGTDILDENGDIVEIWRIRETYVKLGKNYKFLTVEYDNPFFESLIYRNNDTGNVYDSASKHRIAKAKEVFEKLFSNAEIPEILSWKKIIDEAVVTTFRVDDKIQATQIFAFQNDRGKDLTTLEKLKAYLMHKVYAIAENENPESIIRNIELEFADIYKQSEKISYEEDRVLGFHNTAYLSGGENALNSVKSTIAKIDGNVEKEKWINDFVRNLKETFYTIEKIEKEGKKNNAIADTLLLDSQNSIPLLIKLYHFHKGNEKDILEIMKLVENILFKLLYTIGDYRTNSLPTIARHYEGDYDELKEKLIYHTKHGFQWWWDFTGNCINYFTKNTYHYDGRIKYILWKYENYLRDSGRARLLTPNDFKNKYEAKRKENTIDHITPQTPNFTEYTDDFKNDFLHNIGNLGLMVWGDNSEKKDHNPIDKIDLFDKDFFSNKEIKTTLETTKVWSEKEITDRKNTLIDFIFKNWNLK